MRKEGGTRGTMQIKNIIASDPKWSAVFYDGNKDALVFRHVVAWGLEKANQDHEGMPRYGLSGFVLEEGDLYPESTDYYETSDHIFLGYYTSPVVGQDSMLSEGRKQYQYGIRRRTKKALCQRLKRQPTEEEVSAYLAELRKQAVQ
jgi:hypothetical protein